MRYDLLEMLTAWQEQFAKLAVGKISREDYERWRYYYPKYDTTQIWASIPSQELGDALLKQLRQY